MNAGVVGMRDEDALRITQGVWHGDTEGDPAEHAVAVGIGTMAQREGPVPSVLQFFPRNGCPIPVQSDCS